MELEEENQRTKLTTRPEIAKQIGRTGRTVDGWVKRGILPPPTIHHGRIACWDRSAVDAALKGGQQ